MKNQKTSFIKAWQASNNLDRFLGISIILGAIIGFGVVTVLSLVKFMAYWKIAFG